MTTLRAITGFHCALSPLLRPLSLVHPHSPLHRLGRDLHLRLCHSLPCITSAHSQVELFRALLIAVAVAQHGLDAIFGNPGNTQGWMGNFRHPELNRDCRHA